MTRKNQYGDLLVGYFGFAALILLLRWISQTLLLQLPVPALLALRLLLPLVPAVPALLILRLKNAPLRGYGFSRDQVGRQILTGVGLGAGMGFVLTVLPCLAGLEGFVYQGEAYHNPWYALYELVYFLLSVGLVEEFVFRGFLYRELCRLSSSWFFPALCSSLLFGLTHLVGGSPFQVLTTTLIGLFFCWCSEHLPCCTVLSLSIAHGLHDWLIRVVCSLL